MSIKPEQQQPISSYAEQMIELQSLISRVVKDNFKFENISIDSDGKENDVALGLSSILNRFLGKRNGEPLNKFVKSSFLKEHIKEDLMEETGASLAEINKTFKSLLEFSDKK
ncbi:MAG: hypothetical protein WCL07_04405 [bacterium]